jgi:hypothetical protein
MAERFLSQNKIEKLLRDLQTNQVESPNVDGKITLNLKELGDRATLIRHISAIANSGQEGYLIIGVEDRTWKPVGLPADSSLVNSDETQKQINQILSGRIDPSLSVSYRTYKYENALLGVVLIPSENPPYIISIPDDKYGGLKSDGNKENYVHKGAIYIRRGSDSVIANRQSEVFGVLEARKNIVGVIEALGLTAFVIAVGVGMGASLIKFLDVYVPTILGSAWGLLIGLLFSHRVSEAFGRFPKNLFSSILRSTFAPLIGMLIGAWLSHNLAGVVLSGKVKSFDPLSMGLIVAPIVLVINFLPAILVMLALEYIPLGKWVARLFNKSRRI